MSILIKNKTLSHKKFKKKTLKKSYKLVELKFYISLAGRESDINDFSKAPKEFQKKTFLVNLAIKLIWLRVSRFYTT